MGGYQQKSKQQRAARKLPVAALCASIDRCREVIKPSSGLV
jgi:hypothetical protein